MDTIAKDAKRAKSKEKTRNSLTNLMADKGITKEILDKEQRISFG